MRYFIKLFFIITVSLLILSSCNEDDVDNSIDQLQNKFDTYKLPTYIQDNNSAVWKQYTIDDHTAVSLAQAVRSLLWNDENIIEDFTDIKNISDVQSFQLIAFVQHDLPEILNIETIPEIYPNHSIAKFISDETSAGRQPYHLYYIDDLQEMIIKLFGEENESLLDVTESLPTKNYGTFEVYPNEGVISLTGDYVMLRALPQIIHYEKTKDGYICDAVLIPPYGTLQLSSGEVIEITKENFTTYQHLLAHYKYTFKYDSNGNLILSGLETITYEEIPLDDKDVTIVAESTTYPPDVYIIGDSLILKFDDYVAQYDAETMTEVNRMEYNPYGSFCRVSDKYIILLYFEHVKINHEGYDPEVFCQITERIEFYDVNLNKVKEVTIESNTSYVGNRVYTFQPEVFNDNYIVFMKYDKEVSYFYTYILNIDNNTEICIDEYDGYDIYITHYFVTDNPNVFMADGYLHTGDVNGEGSTRAIFYIDVQTGEIIDIIYGGKIDHTKGIVRLKSNNGLRLVDTRYYKVYTYDVNKYIGMHYTQSAINVCRSNGTTFIIAYGSNQSILYGPIYLFKIK